MSQIPSQWDSEADILVVGFAASVSAHEAGADVLLLEKAPEGKHGGNTKVAGQGYLNTSDPIEAAKYLRALCGIFAVPEEMVLVWADEMCRNNDWRASLRADLQEHQHQPVGIEFPELPGAFSTHKFHDGPKYGYSLTWKKFKSLVRERPIRIEFETAGKELIQDGATGEIRGI